MISHFTMKSPDLAVGAHPSMVRPTGNGPPVPSLVLKGGPFFNSLSHRPVKRVSHLPTRLVAYHSA